MDLERFLNQQNIDRYLKLLSLISDERQRRQVMNLLEEERLTAVELDRTTHCAAQPEAAA
jgi:hypothetical protein